MNLINLHKDKIFYFLVSLVFITLPFPSYALNSKAIILLGIYWLFYSSFKTKFENLKNHKISFLLVSSVFVFLIIALISTDNLSHGFKHLSQSVSLLLIPLIIFSTKIDKDIFNKLLSLFSASVVITSFFAIIKTIYLKFNYVEISFYHTSFSEILKKHTTYFALFTCVSIIYYINQYIKKPNRKISLVLSFYLIIILYILSARISIIALIISVSILFWFKVKQQLNWKLLVGLFLLLLLYFTPNFQKRFKSKTIERQEINDIDYRLRQWKVIFELTKDSKYLLGFGTGSDRVKILDAYRKNNLNNAYKLKYNAHNQFIEYAIYFGYIGVLFLILIAFKTAIVLYHQSYYFGLSIYLLFIIFMMTESILERHSGIVLYALLTSIILKVSNVKYD